MPVYLYSELFLKSINEVRFHIHVNNVLCMLTSRVDHNTYLKKLIRSAVTYGWMCSQSKRTPLCWI